MLPVLRNNSALAPVATGPINRLDSFFDRVFGDDGGLTGRAWNGTPVAMWEDDDHIVIEAELPGVADQDLDITVHNGMLFIRGERKPEQGRRYLYNGRWYGRFDHLGSNLQATSCRPRDFPLPKFRPFSQIYHSKARAGRR